VFRQFGFIIAKDLSELLYFAKAFSTEPLPLGKRVAIITNGGGTGVLTADSVYLEGLELADFSENTKVALRKVLPSLVNIRNPLDLAGDADEVRYDNALSLVTNDPNVDMLIVIALFQTPGADSTVASKLIYYKKKISKPMVVITAGSDYTQTHKTMMESSGLPVYDSPMAATSSLTKLLKYKEYIDRDL